jgi:hypothetical protein
MDLFGTLFALVTVFCVYMFPAIVASVRERPNHDAIAAFNLFFGWTIIGWLVCLIWALTSTSSQMAASAKPSSPKLATPLPVASPPPASWRAPVAESGTAAAQAILDSLVEGDRVSLVDLKTIVAVRFGDENIGVLDPHDEQIARAYVAKGRQIVGRVAAVSGTTPKRLIVTISAS